jgi:hypothetical protein
MFEMACLGMRGNLCCLATLASQDQSRLATDDPVSIDMMRTILPVVPLLTTPALVYEWQAVMKAPSKLVVEVVQQMEERANFAPIEQDPFYSWWKQHTM